MASRVVPGRSLTMVRGSPMTALKSDDLPALGRPTMTTGSGSSESLVRAGVARRAEMGDLLHDEVQQVAGAGAVQRRDRHRLADAELVEVGVDGDAGRVVELVGHEQDGYAHAAQHLGDLVVAGQRPAARVDHEEHQVGVLHGGQHLAGGSRRRRATSSAD